MNQNISKPQGSNPAGEGFFFSQSLCQKKIICGLVDYLQLWIEETLHPPEDDVLLLAKYAWCSPPLDRVGKNRSEENLGFQMAKKTLKYWVATEIVARTKCVFGVCAMFF